MGTNYYVRQKSKLATHNANKKKALKDAYTNYLIGLIPIIESHYEDRIPKDIHIGKLSSGWNFLWNLNKSKYYTNKKELIAFLKECEIYSEYGVVYSFDEFWNEIASKRTNKTHKENSSFPNHYVMIDDLEAMDCNFC